MDDTRSIVERLFARRREVDGFPYLHGNQEIDYPARRNRGRAYLSAILCKACWVALKGDVLAMCTLMPPGRVQVEKVENAVLQQSLPFFRGVGGEKPLVDRKGRNPFPQGDAEGCIATPRALAQPHQQVTVERPLPEETDYGAFQESGHMLIHGERG